MAPLISYSWVDHSIENIAKQVAKDVENTQQKHARLHNRKVAPVYSLDKQPPYSGLGEDCLHDYGPGQGAGEYDYTEGNDRNGGILEAMSPDYGKLGETL